MERFYEMTKKEMSSQGRVYLENTDYYYNYYFVTSRENISLKLSNMCVCMYMYVCIYIIYTYSISLYVVLWLLVYFISLFYLFKLWVVLLPEINVSYLTL